MSIRAVLLCSHFAVLTLAETQQLINTLQSYIDEDLPPRGTMTDDEIVEKVKRIL